MQAQQLKILIIEGSSDENINPIKRHHDRTGYERTAISKKPEETIKNQLEQLGKNGQIHDIVLSAADYHPIFENNVAEKV